MRTTRRIIQTFLSLLLLYTLLSVEASAQLSTEYPTQNGYTMRLHISYDLPPTAGGPYTPQTGYFKLRSGLGDLYDGGWIKFYGIDENPPTEAVISTGTIIYPIRIDPDSTFNWNVPASLRDKIHIESKVILRPKHDLNGSIAPHTVPYPITLDLFYQSNYNFRFDPTSPVDWIDQDVALRVEVWLDSSIVDASRTDPNGRYVYELPRRQVFQNNQPTAEFISPMRTIKPALTQISPYLVPIAITGRPPGDQSWSKLTATSGAGAALAISQGETTSRTNETSVGFGPFYNSPTTTETVARSKTVGNYQIYNSQLAVGIQTNNPYRPGEGDVMVCLRRPAFELYRATYDLDFKFLPPPSAAAPLVFPMKELLNPQAGTPLINLTASENSAMQALNPLLADPHAALSEPRYYMVLDLALTGAAISGSLGAQTVSKQQVENILQNSISTRTDSSFTLPIGSLASAVGSPVPLPDLNARHIETTTASTEYRTVNTLELSSGTLLEFVIADSNPSKWIYTQIFYDTVFGTFAFRDSGPPQFTKFLASIREEYQIDKLVLKYWKAIAQDEPKAVLKKYTVIGSLFGYNSKGFSAEFTPQDKSKTSYRVSILPETQNVMIPNLTPGEYSINIDKAKYKLILSKEGEVSFKKAS